MIKEDKVVLFGKDKEGSCLFPEIARVEISEEDKQKYKVPYLPATAIEAKIVKVDKQPLAEGTEVFLLGEIDFAHPSYIEFQLSNVYYGNIKGRMFKRGISEAQEEIIEQLSQRKGSSVQIIGSYNEYPKESGNFSINVSSIAIDDTDSIELTVKVEENMEKLRDLLLSYVESIEKDTIRAFVKTVLEEVWELFVVAPAAKGHHHNYLGGLLQHTVEVTRVADVVARELDKGIEEADVFLNKVYKRINAMIWVKGKMRRYGKLESLGRWKKEPLEQYVGSYIEVTNKLLSRYIEDGEVNRDIIVAGAILHDVGKVFEYDYVGDKRANKYKLLFGEEVIYDEGGAIQVSEELGMGLGHIVDMELYMQKIWVTKWKKIGIELFDYINLLKIVSTHHLKEEWGSPSKAERVEELVVHLADNLDSTFCHS